MPAASGLAIGSFIFFFAVPTALVGWNANLRHLQTWSQFIVENADDGGVEQRSGNSHSMRNQSLHNAVYRLGNFVYRCCGAGPNDRLVEKNAPPKMPMDAAGVDAVLMGVRLLILLALLLAGVRLAGHGDRLSMATALSLGCVALLAISPVARGHYFLLFVPGIFFVPLWCRCRGGCRTIWPFAAAPIVMIDLHYFILPFSGRIGLLGLCTTAWLLAALVAIARPANVAGIIPLPQRAEPDAYSAGQKAA